VATRAAWLFATVVAVGLAAGSSAGAGRAGVCERYRCRTLAANDAVRIFRAIGGASGEETSLTMFAQWRMRRPVVLDAEITFEELSSRLGPLALSGDEVGYGVSSSLGYNDEGLV